MWIIRNSVGVGKISQTSSKDELWRLYSMIADNAVKLMKFIKNKWFKATLNSRHIRAQSNRFEN